VLGFSSIDLEHFLQNVDQSVCVLKAKVRQQQGQIESLEKDWSISEQSCKVMQGKQDHLLRKNEELWHKFSIIQAERESWQSSFRDFKAQRSRNDVTFKNDFLGLQDKLEELHDASCKKFNDIQKIFMGVGMESKSGEVKTMIQRVESDF
jgi:molecular chaperone GrpE (heat shock protein)